MKSYEKEIYLYNYCTEFMFPVVTYGEHNIIIYNNDIFNFPLVFTLIC